tara:strand:- start:7491 stop:7760 length:270 start_codon:yes stop_codon:yes gene_type:complete
MFDLRVFKLAAGRTVMTSSSLHRWTMYSGEKVLNCQERIKRCHSMNFEDYSFDNKEKHVKIDNAKKNNIYHHDELYVDNDIGIYMLTLG